MKKYKLEITIACIFSAMLVGLLWTTLAAKLPALPFILLGVCLFVLSAAIVPWPSKDDADADMGSHEKYAPKFFAQVLISSVVGIALIIGIAAVLNRDRFSKTIDLTDRKVNSLSDETIKFLETIPKEVAVYCIPSMDPRENYCGENQHLRMLYAQRSKEKLKHVVVNPGDIATLQQVKPAGYGRLVIVTDNNRSEIVGKVTESKFTNALISLIKTKKTVYFLTGTGEPPIGMEGEKNYGGLAEILKNRAYEVKEHSITAGDLPADAQMVVAGSNTVPYSSIVENMLRRFLSKGGKLIVTVNPYRDTGLHKLFADLGIKLEPTLLINNQGATPLGAQLSQVAPMRPPLVIGEFSRESPVTSVLTARDIGLVDGARPITVSAVPESTGLKVKQTQLISAFHAAPVSLTDDQRNKLPLDGPLGLKPEAGFDIKKTYPVAFDVEIENPEKLAEGLPAATLAGSSPTGTDPASVTATPTPAAGEKAADAAKKDGAEVIVFGFEFAGPYERAAPANGAVMPLAVSHLYRDKELVTIPTKDFAPRQFNLEKNPASFLFLFAGFLPIATALTGFYIWMRRRSA